MQIPRVFHQIWLGEAAMHPLMVKWRAAWEELHPSFCLKLWTEGSKPEEIACGDERFTSQYPELLARACHLSQRSNIFRYELLWKLGGVYLDTDVEPLRNIEPAIENCAAFVPTFYNRSDYYGNSIIGAVPRSTWAEELVAGLPEQDPSVSLSMGTTYMTGITMKHPEVYRVPRDVFVHWLATPWQQARHKEYVPQDETLAVHHWSSGWFPAGFVPLEKSPEMDKSMCLITESYRQLNESLHRRSPLFGANGAKWTARVVEHLRACQARTYLDYGCGKGNLARTVKLALPELDVRTYDPATAPGLPLAADFVTCCDVLEHVEPELLDNVLAHLAGVVAKEALIVIALRPSDKILDDGRGAHLIVENSGWWLSRMERYFAKLVVKEPLNPALKDLVLLVEGSPCSATVSR